MPSRTMGWFDYRALKEAATRDGELDGASLKSHQPSFVVQPGTFFTFQTGDILYTSGPVF